MTFMPGHGSPAAWTAEPSFFDPAGYDFPDTAIVVAGYKIEWSGLRTLDYYYEGLLHYDRPRFVPPSARLTLTRVSDHDECDQPVVTRDVLTVVCRTTSIGLVLIRGTFVDKRGQFWNRTDVTPRTIVATATVTVVLDGEERLSRRVKFTYSQGD
jgi:hypothetical protein